MVDISGAVKDWVSVNKVPEEENFPDNVENVPPLLDAVTKDVVSEVETEITGRRKRQRGRKRGNAVNGIQSMHQMEVSAGSTGDMALTNGILEASNLEKAEQPRVDAVAKGNGSDVNTNTRKKRKAKNKVNVSDEIPHTHQIKMDMGSNGDLPPLEIAEQPGLDAVPKEYGSGGNTDTPKKKRRRRKAAVREIQCMHGTEKNTGSTENLVQIKTQMCDNVGANTVAANNEPEKNLPDKDAPLKLSEHLELDVMSKETALERSEDITDIKTQKKKDTDTNEEHVMDQTGMGSTENLVEIKSRVNDSLGGPVNSSGYHVVVNNVPDSNIPSKDILMLDVSEQPQMDVSKENASDTDTTKKKKRRRKRTVIAETQCMDQTGMNMASTENHMESKAQISDSLGVSDNLSVSDKDLPALELSEQPKLEISKDNASTHDIDMTKKREKAMVVNENHAIQDVHQTEMNGGITENHMDLNGSDNIGDYHVVNNEPEKNLPDKDLSMLEPVKHPEIDGGLVVDASEATTGTKKKKKPRKKVNVDVDQTPLNAVTMENVTDIFDQKNGTLEASNTAVIEELENNLVDKEVTTLPLNKHSNFGPTSTENRSENEDTERKRKQKVKKANVVNEVPIIESTLEGNTETKKRKRPKSKKVADMSEVKSTTQLEMNSGASENLAYQNQIGDQVEPADKAKKWISKETERSVARKKNKLKKMNPSDAMYKILFSDEEPVDAMFKILLPDPPTCLVHSVPKSQQQHHLNQVTKENNELVNGINGLKNEKGLPECSGKLQTIVSVNPIRRKLIVLDVNGLLADVVMPAPKDCRGDVHILRRAIFKRPFCDDFLKFCFQNFDVGIWSSRSKVIVDRIVEYLLGSRKDKLLFCWNMSQATQTRSKTLDNVHKPLVFKELRKIWENFEGYSESNTLLLDDSPYKALLNPLHTAIFPSSFHYGDKKDNSLGPGGDLRVYLEGLLSSDNVRSYVEQNPFGQGAINETNPSWEFYSTVLQTVTVNR